MHLRKCRGFTQNRMHEMALSKCAIKQKEKHTSLLTAWTNEKELQIFQLKNDQPLCKSHLVHLYQAKDKNYKE